MKKPIGFLRTIAFNHASILAHLLLLTLRTKYKLSLQIRFYQPDMGHATDQFINIYIYIYIYIYIFTF